MATDGSRSSARSSSSWPTWSALCCSVTTEAVAASGPWLSRDTIHQATGMVVAQLRVSPEDALAVLRAHAYGQQATLSEIASAVVDRRVKFSTR